MSDKKNYHFSGGFTLLEVLTVVFILGILVVAGGNLFFSILKGASKAEVTKEVKQNGDYAVAVMERMIRGAQDILSNSDGLTCEDSMAKLRVLNQDGGTTEFGCALEDGVTKIASNSAGRLTGKNVTLGGTSCTASSLSFSCVKGTLFVPPRVTFSFTLSQKGTDGRVEEQSQVSFQETVSLRTY